MKQVKTLAIAVMVLCFSLSVSAQNRKWKMYGHTFQEPNSKFSISVIHDNRSHWKLGVGWYRAINPSFIFWPYVTSTDIRIKAKREWSKNSVFLKVNLDSIAAKLIREKVNTPLGYRSDSRVKNNVLTVRTSAMIYIEENNYQLSFTIEAIFTNEKREKNWMERYSYSVPDNRPLFGEGSLTTNNGELLKSWAEQGLNRCIETLFIDLKGDQSNWRNDTILPKELKTLPEGLLSERGFPEGTILLQETNDDWTTRQPLGLFGKLNGGFVVGIVSKDKNRLLPHPIESKTK